VVQIGLMKLLDLRLHCVVMSPRYVSGTNDGMPAGHEEMT
jgi:hypothetical protein